MFDKTIKMLCQLASADSKHASAINDFIVTILRKTETAFVHNQTGKPSIAAETLKAIPDEKLKHMAKSV